MRPLVGQLMFSIDERNSQVDGLTLDEKGTKRKHYTSTLALHDALATRTIPSVSLLTGLSFPRSPSLAFLLSRT